MDSSGPAPLRWSSVFGSLGVVALAVTFGLAGCRRATAVSSPEVEPSSVGPAPGFFSRLASAIGFSQDSDVPSYTGHDARGIPHYAQRTFTPEERGLLRAVYGVEDPSRLYVSDSTEGGLLEYDTQVKRCMTCYVNSYTIGFVSIRRPGESWEDLERRVRTMRRSDFPAWALVESTALDELDPETRPLIERMLADARAAGFRLRITAAYRSPEREAFLFWEGGGRTHTLTSLHSYGRAVDVVVGDGNLGNRATRAAWVGFRQWVRRYDSGAFHILGRPDASWDWPHVEVPSSDVGFRSIDDALAVARRCVAGQARAPTVSCNFPSHAVPTASRKP
jgi:hypothetical protein